MRLRVVGLWNPDCAAHATKTILLGQKTFHVSLTMFPCPFAPSKLYWVPRVGLHRSELTAMSNMVWISGFARRYQTMGTVSYL